MKIHKKNLSSLLIALLSISAFFGVLLSTVNAQLTPYNINGTIAAYGTVWHNIYEIKQNELVLISISGSELLDTVLYYPNQTLVASAGFTHAPVYQFNASVSGTYLLRLSGWAGGSANYSISSSNPFDVPPTSASTSVEANKTKVIDAFALFGVDVKNATYTWNFGDGTLPETTSNGQITHIYPQVGTFNIALTVNEVGTGLTQNFKIPIIVTPEVTVIVEPPTGYLPAIATVIAALIALVGSIYVVKRKKKKKSQNQSSMTPTKLDSP